ncbi:MAG: thioredoxin family protein [Patescibacteria group bacterium]|nr:thioredoxin family protein [Patescibacteria group bacterium]MDD3777875.1 thioredoxin family protein [Patescibacteria group bacterium]MDD3939756.1 thioredoxin family protein [Patescibacteria group bacterium]MDD4443801.1 thioredoxin family protein [Patescibacteria group bacterium]
MLCYYNVVNNNYMKILKFGAEWCSGCIIMKPRFKEIETENPWLETEYYDFDIAKDVVEKYKIDEVLPTFVFLDKKGKEFLRLQGEVQKKKIIEIINENKEK